MGKGRKSYEEGVLKKRPPMLPDRGGATGESGGVGTEESLPANQGSRKNQCPKKVTIVLPPTETLPIGSLVSLTLDEPSPSGIALVYGNRLIPLPAESVSETLGETLRECLSQGVDYVGPIERYDPDPTRLAAFLRKE